MVVAVAILVIVVGSGVEILLTSTFSQCSSAEPNDNRKLADTLVENTNYTSNHFPAGEFEEWTNSHTPEYVDESNQMREKYWWYASDPWPVNEGTSSAGLQSRTFDSYMSSVAYWRQSPSVPTSSLTFEFDWYTDSNPNPTPGGCQLYMELWFNNGKYMEYYLSGSPSAGNYTNTGRIIINGSIGSWNHFNRNITSDYLSITEFGGSLPESHAMTMINFYAWSRGNVREYLRGFIDDLWVTNELTVYIGGTERNGNFESEALWSNSQQQSYAALTQSSFSHSGSWSMNHTVMSDGNTSSVYAQYQPMIHLSEINQGVLESWYNIHDWAMASDNTYSVIQLEIHTESYNMYAYYYLCAGGAGPIHTNTSTSVVFASTGYNQTGQWVNIQRNLWQDLSTYFSLTEALISQISIRTQSTNPQCKLTILIDDVSLVSSLVDDMGYEDQGVVGASIQGYQSSAHDFADDSRWTVTNTSFAGSKAANLTMTEASSFSLYHALCYPLLNYTPLPIRGTEEIFLDARWQLDDAIDIASGYVSFRIESLDNKKMNYVLSRNLSDGMTNTSSEGFINVKGINTEGEWMYLHRDIVRDYEAVFGMLPNTKIRYLYLRASTAAGDSLSILLDDVYMYTDSAPRISFLGQSPLIPEPTEEVQVSANITDASTHRVLLNYRVNSGTWQYVAMEPQTDSLYLSSIPAQQFDALVEYYISANDTMGWVSVYPSDSNFLAYAVEDSVAPEVLVVFPQNNTEVTDDSTISISASDAGSGIAFVEIYINASLVSNMTEAPFQYEWNTSEYENGFYVIVASAIDCAGNAAETKIIIELRVPSETTTTTTSPPTTTSPTTTTPTTSAPPEDDFIFFIIFGIVGAAAVAIIVVIAQRRNKTS